MRRGSWVWNGIAPILAGMAEELFALAVVGLVALGIGGLLYKVLRTDSWLGSALRQWDRQPVVLWAAAVVLTCCALAARSSLTACQQGMRLGNFAAYTFLSLGLFFLFKLLVTGSL